MNQIEGNAAIQHQRLVYFYSNHIQWENIRSTKAFHYSILLLTIYNIRHDL